MRIVRRWVLVTAMVVLTCAVPSLHQIEMPALQKASWRNDSIGRLWICCFRKSDAAWSRHIAKKESEYTEMSHSKGMVCYTYFDHERCLSAQSLLSSTPSDRWSFEAEKYTG